MWLSSSPCTTYTVLMSLDRHGWKVSNDGCSGVIHSAYFGCEGRCVSTLGGVRVIGDFIYTSADLAPLDRDCIPAVLRTHGGRVAQSVFKKHLDVIKLFWFDPPFSYVFTETDHNRPLTWGVNDAVVLLGIRIIGTHCCCGIVLDYSSTPSDHIVQFYVCCDGRCLGI